MEPASRLALEAAAIMAGLPASGKSGQRQHEAERDDRSHRGVVDPQSRQAQVGEPPRRDESRTDAQEVADQEQHADAGVQYDEGEQRGGGRTERMLARIRNDAADQNDDRGDRGDERKHRRGRSSPAARRLQHRRATIRAP